MQRNEGQTPYQLIQILIQQVKSLEASLRQEAQEGSLSRDEIIVQVRKTLDELKKVDWKNEKDKESVMLIMAKLKTAKKYVDEIDKSLGEIIELQLAAGADPYVKLGATQRSTFDLAPSLVGPSDEQLAAIRNFNEKSDHTVLLAALNDLKANTKFLRGRKVGQFTESLTPHAPIGQPITEGVIENAINYIKKIDKQPNITMTETQSQNAKQLLDELVRYAVSEQNRRKPKVSEEKQAEKVSDNVAQRKVENDSNQDQKQENRQAPTVKFIE